MKLKTKKYLVNESVDGFQPANAKPQFTSNVFKNVGNKLTDNSVEEDDDSKDKRKKRNLKKLIKKTSEKKQKTAKPRWQKRKR